MNPLVCIFVFALCLCLVQAFPVSRRRSRLDHPALENSPFVDIWKSSVAYRSSELLLHQISPQKNPREHLFRLQSSQPSNDSIPQQSEEKQGLTYDRCCKESDCGGGRICFGGHLITGEYGPCTFHSQECRCVPISGEEVYCEADGNCEDGEICAVVTEDELRGEPSLCISKEAVPSSLLFTPLNESVASLAEEPCFNSSQCAFDRQCEVITHEDRESDGPCPGLPGTCLCRPPGGPLFCESDDDCAIDGEVCAALAHMGKRVCTSTALADETTIYTHQGVTGDFCLGEQDCLGERRCLSRNGDPCDGDCICAFREPEECGSDEDCDSPREICAISKALNRQECVSRVAAKGSGYYDPPQDDPANPRGGLKPQAAVCVDARSLSHLAPSELVFPKDILAQVLCDSNGSCATSGHMVHFRGTPMRMSSYCRIVGCKPSEMLVNSPRLRRGVRILTKTESLLFTALAARYDTFIEEVALQTVLRLGW